MSKDYIRDNGKIRNCSRNKAKMNILEYIWLDITANNFFKNAIIDIGEQFIEGAKYLGAAIINTLMIILFPITLLMRAFQGIKDAKKDVRDFEKVWK